MIEKERQREGGGEEPLVMFIRETVGIIKAVSSQMPNLPEDSVLRTRQFLKESIDSLFVNLWMAAGKDSLNAFERIAEGKGGRFAGFDLGGEKWRISGPFDNSGEEVYLGPEDIKVVFVSAGGSEREAEELFPRVDDKGVE